MFQNSSSLKGVLLLSWFKSYCRYQHSLYFCRPNCARELLFCLLTLGKAGHMFTPLGSFVINMVDICLAAYP